MYPFEVKNKQRWPYSNTKACKPIGSDSTYAHHMMELQFPETIGVRIKGN